MKKWFLRVILILIAAALVFLLAVYLINRRVESQTFGKIQTSITEIPIENPPLVAVVLGAKVLENGELSNALYDRVVTAVELHRAKRVKKILMSGDRQNDDYDEPTKMKNAAMSLGVPENDIVLDYAGHRTYDTCFRAKAVFEVSRAIIVTQEFHQPRAIYLCENFGIESVGITANRRTYLDSDQWARREFFSIAGAWFEINFLPKPAAEQKQPILQ